MTVNMSLPSPEPDQHTAIHSTHRHQYHVSNLETRSVTLCPSCALIVRDIKDIPLEVGANQVEITGLTSTLDEDSVRVETSDALITELSIELVPNRETPDAPYFRSLDSDDESSDSEVDLTKEEKDDDKESRSDKLKLKNVLKEISDLVGRKRTALATISIAEDSLKIVNLYGNNIATSSRRQSKTTFEEDLSTYHRERQSVFREQMAAEAEANNIDQKIMALSKQKRNLRKRFAAKRRDRAQRVSGRDGEKRRGNGREPADIDCPRNQRHLQWNEKVYAITVNIDVKARQDNGVNVILPSSLTLSYATTHASWSPVHDLALSTNPDKGTLYFDARLVNHTSENWDDCIITLATSEPNAYDLSNPPPTLDPWRVYAPVSSQKHIRKVRGLMFSQDERHLPVRQRPASQPQRTTLPASTRTNGVFRNVRAPEQRLVIFEDATAGPERGDRGVFGKENVRPARDGRLFGTSNQVLTDDDGNTSESQDSVDTHRNPSRNENDPDSDDDATTILSPDFEMEDADTDETGIPASYTLDGLRSLPPSATVSRHRVACIPFQDVVFRRVLVPKHKRAVFMKAELRSGGKLTLPKGMSGLTLDGRYLGRIELPCWEPASTLSINLGIDPSIRVGYPRPEAKHSIRSGPFPGDNSIYTRSITLLNTAEVAAGKPIRVTVLDQVPVSQDGGLDIAVVEPAGLVVNGPSVPTGEYVGDGGERICATALAKLEEDGEVEWTVDVNPGRTVKLNLSYACAIANTANSISIFE
ncbi:hypothetical protein F4777DRAFT_494530 [Nemania sp. FL0916]|nr:hypothetical protein F4777DRAFT_494530 [Nemania sp. FL0916]